MQQQWGTSYRSMLKASHWDFVRSFGLSNLLRRLKGMGEAPAMMILKVQSEWRGPP